MLDQLRGDKDSLHASQQWFLACTHYAPGMAAAMAARGRWLSVQASAGDAHPIERCMHLLYLANEILFAAKRARPSEAQGWAGDAVAAAFRAPLSSLLGSVMGRVAAAGDAQLLEQYRSRLKDMVTLWSRQEVRGGEGERDGVALWSRQEVRGRPPSLPPSLAPRSSTEGRGRPALSCPLQ